MIDVVGPMVIVGVLACDATHACASYKLVDVSISDGLIVAITPHGSAPPVGTIVDGRNRLIVPGYVNGHQHSHELFFRGRSERLALEQWMTSVRPIRPLALSAQDVYLRTLAVAAEALRSGTTTICDDVGLDLVRRPDHLEALVQAYDESGIRAFVGPTLFDIPFARAVPFADEELPPLILARIDALFSEGPPPSSVLASFRAFAKARAIVAGRVKAIAAPSAVQRCTPAFLSDVRALASDLALPVMMHCLETRVQAVGAQLAHGMSTVRWLDKIGFLQPETTLIHGVWLDRADIDTLARTGATVQHNPMSNVKIGSGVAPIRALLDAGVNVSLGSDGCGSIETLSPQPGVAAAALLSTLRGAPEAWVSALEAFRIGTIGGAIALGLEREIGRIAPGYRADFVLYRLDRAPFMPLNDPLRQLVFGEYGANVATVIVDGRLVFDEGRLLTIDEDRLFSDLAETHARLVPSIVQAEAGQCGDGAGHAPHSRPVRSRSASRCLRGPSGRVRYPAKPSIIALIDETFRPVAAFAMAHPTPWPHDLRQVLECGTFDPPPWNIVKGPVRPRGGPAGLITVSGRTVAAWGDLDRADMVFSVTKSYVGVLAGIASDLGLVPDLSAPVSQTIDHCAFSSTPNRDVTWLQLLQQTSEWQGTLWGIPDTVDRDRQLAPTDDPARFGRLTPRGAPGSYWDYNDVRVNALCFALTLAFGRALPDILAEHSPAFSDRNAWAWDGYGRDSALPIGDGTIPVVVGGGHWGGGLATSVRHDAWLGRTIAARGVADGRRVLSEAMVSVLLGACPLQPIYGALWWLNTGRLLYPAAPPESVFALGVGLNAVWVDPSQDLVAVVRWIDEPAFAPFVEMVMQALSARA